MRVQIPSGWQGEIHKWLIQADKLWIFRFVIKPIGLGVLPSAITLFYSNKVFASSVMGFAPAVGLLLNNYPTGAVFLAAGYPTFLIGAVTLFREKVRPKAPDDKALLALLRTLDEVVGSKLNRFAGYACAPGSLTKESAFCTITEPMKQIEELIRAVCTFFNYCQPDNQRALIRVVLAVIENGEIAAMPIFFPADEQSRATLEELNDPQSTIRQAVALKRIVIIDDIAKELRKPPNKRRFVLVDGEDDASGSLICYPVRFHHTKEIPYVISIHCEQTGFFKKELEGYYTQCLDRFAIRLCLEYSLFKLKERLIE